jgi:hypothetical protein
MKQDFEYFLENLDKLVTQYGNKYIVIKNKAVLGAYENFESAIRNTAKTEEIGTFIIQQCTKDSSAYTAIFHSNHIC